MLKGLGFYEYLYVIYKGLCTYFRDLKKSEVTLNYGGKKNYIITSPGQALEKDTQI